MPTQVEKAMRLRSLHQPGKPLVLVNVWDAVSARIIEELGFPAIATTSGGISWREGFVDGERISRSHMLEIVAKIARIVQVPVTADLEAAYGASDSDAAETARGAIGADAVGLNFEDWNFRDAVLMDADAQAARIKAMRAAAEETGVPLVINARTDVFLKSAEGSRVLAAIRRGNTYLGAGADCVFVPGVTDARTIEELVRSIEGPVNVLAGPASPSFSRLAEIGVARISVGATAMASALTQFRDIAANIRAEDGFAFTGRRISHAEINALF